MSISVCTSCIFYRDTTDGGPLCTHEQGDLLKGASGVCAMYLSKPDDGEFKYKNDQGKDRWDLLPFNAIEDAVKAITHGANKYGVLSWQKLENPRNRYFAALMRHLMAWRDNELTDPETGISHIGHAIANLVFMDWFDNND